MPTPDAFEATSIDSLPCEVVAQLGTLQMLCSQLLHQAVVQIESSAKHFKRAAQQQTSVPVTRHRSQPRPAIYTEVARTLRLFAELLEQLPGLDECSSATNETGTLLESFQGYLNALQHKVHTLERPATAGDSTRGIPISPIAKPPAYPQPQPPSTPPEQALAHCKLQPEGFDVSSDESQPCNVVRVTACAPEGHHMTSEPALPQEHEASTPLFTVKDLMLGKARLRGVQPTYKPHAVITPTGVSGNQVWRTDWAPSEDSDTIPSKMEPAPCRLLPFSDKLRLQGLKLQSPPQTAVPFAADSPSMHPTACSSAESDSMEGPVQLSPGAVRSDSDTSLGWGARVVPCTDDDSEGSGLIVQRPPKGHGRARRGQHRYQPALLRVPRPLPGASAAADGRVPPLVRFLCSDLQHRKAVPRAANRQQHSRKSQLPEYSGGAATMPSWQLMHTAAAPLHGAVTGAWMQGQDAGSHPWILSSPNEGVENTALSVASLKPYQTDSHHTVHVEATGAAGTGVQGFANKARGTHEKGKRESSGGRAAPLADLQGKRWVVQNFEDAHEIVVAAAVRKQSVHISNCRNCTVRVPNKVVVIMMENCERLTLVFEGVVAYCQAVSCRRIQIQANGHTPTLALDQCDGARMYLGLNAQETSIVHNHSTDMELVVLSRDGECITSNQVTGRSRRLPEQFVSTLVGGRIMTYPYRVMG